MPDSYQPRILPLLLFAAGLTLGVTVLRVVGELQGWDPRWFPSEGGGKPSPVGILWLVPVFGFLFGRRLAQAGAKPAFVASFFVPMFGVGALVAAGIWVYSHSTGPELEERARYLAYGGGLVALLGLFSWPRAFCVLLCYAILARAPVALVQYLDVENGWQTHYGRVPPVLVGLESTRRLWFLTLVQAGFWVPLTILLGGGCAAAGAATVRR
jgi:hypothetical protein